MRTEIKKLWPIDPFSFSNLMWEVGVRKVTGTTGLWQPIIHSEVAFTSLSYSTQLNSTINHYYYYYYYFITLLNNQPLLLVNHWCYYYYCLFWCTCSCVVFVLPVWVSVCFMKRISCTCTGHFYYFLLLAFFTKLILVVHSAALNKKAKRKIKRQKKENNTWDSNVWSPTVVQY